MQPYNQTLFLYATIRPTPFALRNHTTKPFYSTQPYNQTLLLYATIQPNPFTLRNHTAKPFYCTQPYSQTFLLYATIQPTPFTLSNHRIKKTSRHSLFIILRKIMRSKSKKMYCTNKRTAQIQSFYVQSITLFTLFTRVQSVQTTA